MWQAYCDEKDLGDHNTGLNSPSLREFCDEDERRRLTPQRRIAPNQVAMAIEIENPAAAPAFAVTEGFRLAPIKQSSMRAESIFSGYQAGHWGLFFRYFLLFF